MTTKTKYVADDKICLRIQDLRIISIREYFTLGAQKASLEYGYKGHYGSIVYDDKDECRKMYNRIMAALDSMPVPREENGTP